MVTMSIAKHRAPSIISARSMISYGRAWPLHRKTAGTSRLAASRAAVVSSDGGRTAGMTMPPSGKVPGRRGFSSAACDEYCVGASSGRAVGPHVIQDAGLVQVGRDRLTEEDRHSDEHGELLSAEALP